MVLQKQWHTGNERYAVTLVALLDDQGADENAPHTKYSHLQNALSRCQEHRRVHQFPNQNRQPEQTYLKLSHTPGPSIARSRQKSCPFPQHLCLTAHHARRGVEKECQRRWSGTLLAYAYWSLPTISRAYSLFIGASCCAKKNCNASQTYPLTRPVLPNQDIPTSTAKHYAGMYIIIIFPMLSRLRHKMGYRLQH